MASPSLPSTAVATSRPLRRPPDAISVGETAGAADTALTLFAAWRHQPRPESAAARAASEVHDVGLHLKRDADGALGFRVLVGGGLGRAR